MTTLAQIEATFGIQHLDHLDREAAVPTVSQLAFQGDVAVIRRPRSKPATTPIPTSGYPAVRAESAAQNTHLLIGVGFYDPQPASATNLDLGVLTVPAGSEVLLSHPEHGGLLIQPGTYTLRRQREQADELRLVAD